MAASLADVTDVLKRQIETSAELLIELRAMRKAQEKTVELLEELRDEGFAAASDDDDEDDDSEVLGENAGLDGVVDAVAGEIRDRIRRKGLGLFRKKKLNGAAPREAAAAKTTTE